VARNVPFLTQSYLSTTTRLCMKFWDSLVDPGGLGGHVFPHFGRDYTLYDSPRPTNTIF